VSEQVEYLKKTKVVIAVGTPGRIGKLIQEDGEAFNLRNLRSAVSPGTDITGLIIPFVALHIRQQTIILLDASFRDSSAFFSGSHSSAYKVD
jgi:hypothetical protein